MSSAEQTLFDESEFVVNPEWRKPTLREQEERRKQLARERYRGPVDFVARIGYLPIVQAMGQPELTINGVEISNSPFGQ